MLNFFTEIWESTPEKDRVCCITGKPLPPQDHPLWHHSFSHILTRHYSLYKFNRANIKFMTSEVHAMWEHFKNSDKNKPLYKNYSHKWEALFEYQEQLKQQYFQDRKNKV